MKQTATLFLVLTLLLCCVFSSCGTVPNRPLENDNTSANEVVSDSLSAENAVNETVINNSAVQIKVVEGIYYLNFVEGNEMTKQGGMNSSVIGNIFFPTLGDMKNAFLNGSIPESVSNNLKRTLTMSENGYEFFDVRSLYNVVLPDATWELTEVSLYGNMYYVPFKDSGETIDGHVCFLTPQTYDLKYESSVVRYQEEGTLLADVTEYQGVPCVGYEIVTEGSVLHIVIVRMETEYGYSDVLMKYCVAHDKNQDLVNTEVPYQIMIYGTDERQNYILSLNMNEAPSPELLRSFAIVPYDG